MSCQTNSNGYCLGTLDTFWMIMCWYRTLFRQHHGFIGTLCNTANSTNSHGTPVPTAIIRHGIRTLQPLRKTRTIASLEIGPSILEQIITEEFIAVHQPIRNGNCQYSIIRKTTAVLEHFNVFTSRSSKFICRANNIPTNSSDNCITSPFHS